MFSRGKYKSYHKLNLSYWTTSHQNETYETYEDTSRLRQINQKIRKIWIAFILVKSCPHDNVCQVRLMPRQGACCTRQWCFDEDLRVMIRRTFLNTGILRSFQVNLELQVAARLNFKLIVSVTRSRWKCSWSTSVFIQPNFSKMNTKTFKIQFNSTMDMSWQQAQAI